MWAGVLMFRSPDQHDALLVVAIILSLVWSTAALLGDHPDGALLALSGNVLMVWATLQKDRKRRIGKRKREREQKERGEE